MIWGYKKAIYTCSKCNLNGGRGREEWMGGLKRGKCGLGFGETNGSVGKVGGQLIFWLLVLGMCVLRCCYMWIVINDIYLMCV